MKILKTNALPPKQLSRFEKINWTTERLDGCNYFIAAAAIGEMVHMRELFPEISFAVSYTAGRYMIWHYDDRELEALYRKIEKILADDPAYFGKLHANWQEKVAVFYKLCEEFRGKNLRTLSDKELEASYKQFFNTFVASIGAAFFIEGVTVGTRKIFDENLRSFLKSRGAEDKFPEVYQALTAPESPSFVARAEEEARKLKSIKSKAAVTKYLEKYSWIRNNYYEVTKLSEADLASALDASNNATADFKLKEVKNKKKFIAQEYDIPEQIVRQMETLALFAVWQDERKQAVLRCLEILDLFLSKLARRTGVEKSFLKQILPSEFGDALHGRALTEDLQQRSANSFVVWEPERITVLSGDRARTLHERLFVRHLDKTVSSIRGIPASAGKAKGTVKILLSSSEGRKMNKGDILVAGMTRPDYTESMRKAAAIITDEGGITCHAAVVAREWGIPCVVGTKIATQVLKDGDVVEVGANEGVVKIIKRN